MANKLRIGDPQGCEGMVQGLQDEHGFSLVARKRDMTTDAGMLSDGSRGRLDLVGCGRLRLNKVNWLPNYGNTVWTGGASLGLPLKSGCIVQHGESPRKSEELLETAVTEKRHRKSQKSIWKSW